MVVGAFWFMSVVADVDVVSVFVLVDFVVAAVSMSSPGHFKKEQETDREMNWRKLSCLLYLLADAVFNLFLFVLMFWVLLIFFQLL